MSLKEEAIEGPIINSLIHLRGIEIKDIINIMDRIIEAMVTEILKSSMIIRGIINPEDKTIFQGETIIMEQITIKEQEEGEIGNMMKKIMLMMAPLKRSLMIMIMVEAVKDGIEIKTIRDSIEIKTIRDSIGIKIIDQSIVRQILLLETTYKK